MSGRARLLVIGANGFAGGRLAEAARARFDCIPAARSGAALHIDITDADSVDAAFDASRPAAVALLAAIADIDACQRHPELARRTNVDGARHVAAACARTGARLVFTSSGAVFDGTRPEYREDDAPSPLSVYGETKAEAERVVAGLCPGAVVVRPSLLLGFPLGAGTNSLAAKLRGAFERGETVAATRLEYRNAIGVETLVEWILDLAAAPHARGVFHLGSSGPLSRFEIVRGLAQAMGYPAERVVATGSAIPGRAPRGAYEFLVPGRIGRFSGTAVPSCREAIERCVCNCPKPFTS